MIYTVLRENQPHLPFIEATRVPVINTDTSDLAELAAYKKLDLSNKFIGFEHVRRYFSTEHGRPLTEEELIKKLGDKDIIVPSIQMPPLKHWIHPSTFAYTNKICRLHPEYKDAVDEVLNGTTMYPHNMLFTRSKTFKEYRSWLFNIIGTGGTVCNDPKAKSHYGETLLTIYCKHNFKHSTVTCNVTAWSHDLSHIVDTVSGVGD